MYRLEQKIKTLERLFRSLEESYSKFQENKEVYFYKELRDSVIKRFEYTIDYLWKTVKLFLEKKHQVLTAESPKKIFEQAQKAGIISEDELIIFRNMVQDRNNTSHMYQEELSEGLVKNMQNYIAELNKVLAVLDHF